MAHESELLIQRIINAPRKMIWKAWTDPETIKKWWVPEEFTSPSAVTDLRPGGKYIFAMKGPAGSEWDRVMYSSGLYKEVIPHEKLVVTDYFSDEQGNKVDPSDYGQDADFPDETESTVLFEDAGEGKTKLSILYQVPHNDRQREAMKKSGMSEGWNSSLNKLERLLV